MIIERSDSKELLVRGRPRVARVRWICLCLQGRLLLLICVHFAYNLPTYHEYHLLSDGMFASFLCFKFLCFLPFPVLSISHNMSWYMLGYSQAIW